MLLDYQAPLIICAIHKKNRSHTKKSKNYVATFTRSVLTYLQEKLAVFIPQQCMVSRQHFTIENSIVRGCSGSGHRSTHFDRLIQTQRPLLKGMRVGAADQNSLSAHFCRRDHHVITIAIGVGDLLLLRLLIIRCIPYPTATHDHHRLGHTVLTGNPVVIFSTRLLSA